MKFGNLAIIICAGVFAHETIIHISTVDDFFKIGSWLLAYLMIAKAMTKTFIITEIIFAASYVALSYYFMSHLGTIGATYSFCINYSAYWILMPFIMRNKIR